MDVFDGTLERRRHPRPVSAGAARSSTPRVVAADLAPDTLDALSHAFGHDATTDGRVTAEQAAELIDLAIEMLRAGLDALVPPDELARVVASIGVLLRAGRELNARGLTERQRVLGDARAALADLHGLPDAKSVVRRALGSLAHIGDFDHVVLFGVEADTLIVRGAEIPTDPARALELVAFACPQPARGSAAEALRRRSAVLAEATDDDLAICSEQFVLAPLAPAGHAIGLLYADRGLTGRSLDALDRDALWTFAEGFGYALERSVLLERLNAQRRHFRQLVLTGEAVMNELADTPVTMAPARFDDAVLSVALPPMGHGSAEARSRLTPRELDIMPLLAQGARNRDIARRLFISDETVKSHVRRILKKLGATNRAEAVSRYMQLTATGSGTPDAANELHGEPGSFGGSAVNRG